LLSETAVVFKATKQATQRLEFHNHKDRYSVCYYVYTNDRYNNNNNNNNIAFCPKQVGVG
jgi:hypothetical protein